MIGVGFQNAASYSCVHTPTDHTTDSAYIGTGSICTLIDTTQDTKLTLAYYIVVQIDSYSKHSS